MRLSLEEIKSFSQCPVYFWLTRDQGLAIPIPLRRSIVESIMKKCHMQAAETGYRANWKTVVGWVDSEIFEDIEINEDEKFRAARVLSEQILLSVQKWYHEYYLKENYDSFVDIDLQAEILPDVVLYSRIPIVQAGDSLPIISIVRDIGIERIEMYNDLEIRGLAWMVSDQLETEGAIARVLCIGQRGKFSATEISLGRKHNSRASDALREVAHCIRQSISYPSRTTQCETCPFARRCRL